MTDDRTLKTYASGEAYEADLPEMTADGWFPQWVQVGPTGMLSVTYARAKELDPATD